MSALALGLTTVIAAAPTGATFIEDDYARAVTEAKKSRRILFVDAWAPWCHTCIYLREHVLGRPGFKAYEKDVLFAAIDTEKPTGVPLLEKFPVNSWPTLFFIDPATETLLFKWEGTTDEAGLKALLDAARGQAKGTKDADALMGQAREGEAADRYQAALSGLPVEGSARAVISMLTALWRAGRYGECADRALEHRARLSTASEKALGLTWGIQCALRLEPGKRPASLGPLVKEGAAVVSSKAAASALVDDISGLYEVLVEERGEAGDEAGRVARAKAWLAFLDAAAARATTSAERAVFDPHRVTAALAAKTPRVMVKPLEQSEKDFPADYNPPARLALLHLELGELDAALADAERALARSTGGPRKLRLYETKARVLEARKDPAAAAKVMAEAVAYARSLPPAQFPPARLAAYEKKWAPSASR